VGAFWIELKRRVKTAGWALVGAGVAALMATLYLFRKKSQDRPYAERMGPAIDKVHARIEAANAEAKAKLDASAARERRDVDELSEIAEDPDGDRRRQKLIDAAARADRDGK
jgi:hypothetical protein